jgi:geranylgeranyl diphosphate synthase type I
VIGARSVVADVVMCDPPVAAYEVIEQVERVLHRYLTRRCRAVAGVHATLGEFLDALTGFVLNGGKRLRPAFAWWAWRGWEPSEDRLAEPVLCAISALELLHTTALVHDDLIDESGIRRGRPALHVGFAGRHRDRGWWGDGERFGRAGALLLGDLALAWADDLLCEAGLPAAVFARIRPVWSGLRTELVAGQFLDILGPAAGEDGISHALRVSRFKTAGYTVERPVQLGAAIAGAPRSVVAALRRFGRNVGVAFQLRDDLRAVFGDPAVTGKPAGDDLREGKRTLLTALALRQAKVTCDPTPLRVLTAAIGNPALDDEGLDRVRDVLIELGVVERVEAHIERFTATGLAALTSARLAQPGHAALAELAQRMTRHTA